MTPERFYRNTERVGDCLIWQGKGRVGEYGVVGYAWETWLAHRLSYYFQHPDFDQSLVIRHSCDTPLCVEPSHLLEGTHADNVQDKVDRGRQPKTESHWNVKISADDVRKIREKYSAGGVYQKDLAVEYGISTSQANRIITGKRWKGD